MCSNAVLCVYIDSAVCLDQILIQLKEVAPQWRRLGKAVGLEALDDISRHVCRLCLADPESD